MYHTGAKGSNYTGRPTWSTVYTLELGRLVLVCTVGITRCTSLLCERSTVGIPTLEVSVHFFVCVVCAIAVYIYIYTI